MIRYVVLAALLMAPSIMLYSQDLNEMILEKIYKSMVDNETLITLRKVYSQAQLIVDPVSGSKEVFFDPNMSQEQKTAFSKYDYKTQIDILSVDTTLQFPLGDTLRIVDSFGFFEEVFITTAEHKHIYVVQSITKDAKASIRLFASGVRNNYLILSFEAKADQLRNYYFQIINAQLELSKVTDVDYLK